MTMEALLHVSAKRGTVAAGKDAISVMNANAAVLILSAATSFDGFDHDPAPHGKDPDAIAREYRAKAVVRSYQSLLAEHLADYRGLFRRLWVSINGEAPNKYALGY
jgi:alpha-L-fucosidase 2